MYNLCSEEKLVVSERRKRGTEDGESLMLEGACGSTLLLPLPEYLGLVNIVLKLFFILHLLYTVFGQHAPIQQFIQT